MGRRRLQQKGDLTARGGWWHLRWREDALDEDGNLITPRPWSPSVIVGPAPGNANMKPLTKREATREAWERFLSRLDQNNWTPRSVATVAQFVERKFIPDHVALKRKNTRIHYGHLLKNHVLPTIGEMRLRDVRREHVQQLASKIIGSGLSVATAKHVRKVVSAIFTMAEDLEWATSNPAKRIHFPEDAGQKRQDLTWPHVEQIAALLEPPYASMVIILAQTGMRVGELFGLLWKWVNLSDQDVLVAGEKIPPYSILIRENFTAGESQASPKNKRSRLVPMTTTVWVELSAILEKTGGEGLVFPNRKGRPRDAHNFTNRHFKPAAKKLGLAWASPHCLRHTMATLADQAKLTMRERMDILGHADPRTTMRYTHADLERIREKLERAEDQGRKETVQ